jgi:hypothetical protein
VKRWKLMERSEIGDGRASAERDHDPAVDALGQRISPRRELAFGDLRGEDDGGARDNEE